MPVNFSRYMVVNKILEVFGSQTPVTCTCQKHIHCSFAKGCPYIFTKGVLAFLSVSALVYEKMPVFVVCMHHWLAFTTLHKSCGLLLHNYKIKDASG